jgi:hypothetical protein
MHNTVNVIVGKRQTGKTLKAKALILQFIAEHHSTESQVHVAGHDKVVVNDTLKAFNSFLAAEQIDRIRLMTPTGGAGLTTETGMIELGIRLNNHVLRLEPQCFYLQDVPTKSIPAFLILAESAPHHTWIIEAITPHTDAEVFS